MAPKPSPPGEVKENVNKELALAEQERADRRFSYNLSIFEGGDIRVLRSDEFLDKLVSFYLDSARKKTLDLEKINRVLNDGVTFPDISLRERVVTLASILTDRALESELTDTLAQLAMVLCKWLLAEDEPLNVFPVAAKSMATCCSVLLIRGRLQDAAMILDSLSAVTLGRLEKNQIIKSYSGIALEKIASRENLEYLTDQCLAANAELCELHKEMLQKFGQVAVEYLFDRMNKSLSKKERLELISLISSFQFAALPVLSKQLDKQSDWKIVRNGVRIYGELGDESLYPILKPYLKHKDRKVQYEAICSVLKLGGSNLIQRLLEGASIVDDSMKTHMLRLLFEYNVSDADIFKALKGIVNKKVSDHDTLSGELFKTILGILKSHPSREGIHLLNSLNDLTCLGIKQKEKQVRIQDVMHVVSPLVRHQEQRDDGGEKISFSSDPVVVQKAMKRVNKTEDEIKKLLAKGKSLEAGRLVFREAVVAAEDGDFKAAEILKNRLLEVDPMALDELWRLDRKLQDRQKEEEGGYTGDLRSKLLEHFSQAECTAIMSNLKPETYREGERIIQIGDTDTSLYFVVSGLLSMHCLAGGKDVFLKKIGANAVIGAQQFFSASIWTASVQALTDVKFMVMDLESFNVISQKFPYIEPKLREYSLAFDKVDGFLDTTGEERREYPRYAATMEARYTLLDPFGYKTKKIFRGRLLDISKTGLSIKVGVSSRETARMLLGRQIITSLKARNLEIALGEGVIVGVRDLSKQGEGGLSSVHIRLSRMIEEKVFRQILAS